MREDAVDMFRSSTLGWLRGTLAGWGTILLALAGIAAALLGPWGAWPLVAPGIALLVLLVKWVQNLAATYEVTEERLIIHRGIIFKSVDEIELYRVKDIRIDFTLINQWADIGTICVSSSDETTRQGDLVLRHIERARDRREQFRRLVDSARQRRGVRELDMAHDHP
ncbi:PH domain-containing protein [Sphingosinicella terrae]|jgi:uncharacterized membrane protein YdbT with pleckstrin-like domain|uniref:PH domain-containing protein n=1 Tax=Sphingosinicella terrae TaxID=2172047 RepID=UPI000E0D69AE|nr:PH domain-containing protein [Sphingosinicella terrae]